MVGRSHQREIETVRARSARGAGDIGGFGVGSDLAWQAYADVGFRASDLVSVILGYRAIDMDYEDASGRDIFRYDMLISGPQIGVSFTF